MDHPIEEQNKIQKAFLEKLPSKDRPYHKKLFSIGNASIRYHMLSNEYEPTETDFKTWLEGLPEPIKTDMKERGFESCKTHLPFTRFVLERRDIGMDAWMKEHLTKSEYKFYSDQKPKDQ